VEVIESHTFEAADERDTVDLRCPNLGPEELFHVLIPFEEHYQFFGVTKHDDFLLEGVAAVDEGGLGIAGRGYENPANVTPAVNADKVQGHLFPADRMGPPLHFYQIGVAVQFHESVHLLDDALGGVPLEGERLFYNLFLTVYSSIFLQNRGLRNHRGGVAPGAVSPPGADGSTC